MRKAIFAYAIFLAAWNLLRLTPVARLGLFALPDLFGWGLYLPCLAIALASAFRRQWAALVPLVLPLTVFLIEYGPQFTPSRRPSGDTVRVATANLHLPNRLFGEVEQALIQPATDVIAVQELSKNMSIELSRRLRELYPHQALYPRSDVDGLGVFSRFPLSNTSKPQMKPGSCRCMIVETLIAGSRVAIVNAHPRPPVVGVGKFDTSRQSSALGALLRLVDDSEFPIVVLADLNTGDRHRLFRRVRRQLGDAHRDAGWGLGLTWGPTRLNLSSTAKLPIVRIDYVLHTNEWDTRSARTGVIPASDHRYVVADLVLREDR